MVTEKRIFVSPSNKKANDFISAMEKIKAELTKKFEATNLATKKGDSTKQK